MTLAATGRAIHDEPESSLAVKRTPLRRTGSLKRTTRLRPGGKDARRRKAKLPTNTELDRLARAAVFARDGHRCVRCGLGAPAVRVEWAHVYTRGYHSIRHDLDNAWTACKVCHDWFDAHRKAGRAWWETIVGSEVMLRLRLSRGK